METLRINSWLMVLGRSMILLGPIGPLTIAPYLMKGGYDLKRTSRQSPWQSALKTFSSCIQASE